MNRADWIGWAFSAKHAAEARELNAGEKLVLVYLAAQVGADGLARLDREQLAQVTDYEPRSLQRILKSLRDAGLLLQTDSGWYGLGAAETLPAAPPAELLEVTLTRTQVIDQAAPGFSQAELEAAGETIASAVSEAADRMLVRLNDSTLRLLTGIERLVRELDQLPAAEPAPPPPDPVKESAQFKLLVAEGYAEPEAYRLAQLLLAAQIPETSGAGNDRAPARAEPNGSSAAGGLPASTGTPQAAGAAAPALPDEVFADSAEGRWGRIWQTLHGQPPTPEAHAATFGAWLELEEAENKHSVKGETPAFELLFPAILTAARRVRGQMTMREFLDPRAIAAGNAPWDAAAVTFTATDAQLQLEIDAMLQAIERAAHPMCSVPPRTIQKPEEPGEPEIIEPLLAYYLRVKRVYEQLQRLQQMGV